MKTEREDPREFHRIYLDSAHGDDKIIGFYAIPYGPSGGISLAELHQIFSFSFGKPPAQAAVITPWGYIPLRLLFGS